MDFVTLMCGFHYGANGRAGGEKEIGNINTVLVIALTNAFSILIGQFEIGNLMILFNVLQAAVYQLKTDLSGLINGEDFSRG